MSLSGCVMSHSPYTPRSPLRADGSPRDQHAVCTTIRLVCTRRARDDVPPGSVERRRHTHITNPEPGRGCSSTHFFLRNFPLSLSLSLSLPTLPTLPCVRRLVLRRALLVLLALRPGVRRLLPRPCAHHDWDRRSSRPRDVGTPARAWPDDLRLLLMEYLVHRVPPSSIPELVAKTTIAAVPWAIDAGLQLPDVSFVRNLRYELGVLARSEASVTLGESERIAAAGTDETPVNTEEFATFNGRLVNAEGEVEDLIFGGAYRVAQQTAAGQAQAVNEMFMRRRVEVRLTPPARRSGIIVTSARHRDNGGASDCVRDRALAEWGLFIVRAYSFFSGSYHQMRVWRCAFSAARRVARGVARAALVARRALDVPRPPLVPLVLRPQLALRPLRLPRRPARSGGRTPRVSCQCPARAWSRRRTPCVLKYSSTT